jgi:hypothetical protein
VLSTPLLCVCREQLESLLDEYRVDLVVSGHVHSYRYYRLVSLGTAWYRLCTTWFLHMYCLVYLRYWASLDTRLLCVPSGVVRQHTVSRCRGSHLPPPGCSRTCNVLDEHCVPADKGGMTHIIVSSV